MKNRIGSLQEIVQELAGMEDETSGRLLRIVEALSCVVEWIKESQSQSAIKVPEIGDVWHCDEDKLDYIVTYTQGPGGSLHCIGSDGQHHCQMDRDSFLNMSVYVRNAFGKDDEKVKDEVNVVLTKSEVEWLCIVHLDDANEPQDDSIFTKLRSAMGK